MSNRTGASGNGKNMDIEYRYYQEGALEAMKKNLDKPGNDIVVLPTGSGKSIVITGIADHANTDVLILQPSLEILNQNRSKLEKVVDPELISAYSASADEKEIKKYTYAMIGSVYKKPELFKHFKVVLLDECHLLNPKDTGSMFASFLKKIGNPKVIGFTASAFRNMSAYHKVGNDQLEVAITLKMICRLKEKFWSKIIYNVDHGELVEKGYLSPLKYINVPLVEQHEIPLNKTRTDFDLDGYEKVVKTKEERFEDGVKWAIENHKSVLVFCSSVTAAYRYAEKFGGVAIDSKGTKKKERAEIIAGFKDGSIPIVWNVGVLTTGFDHPSLDCIILKRPTRSLALYYQMLGRGVRIAPGKTHCTVIDFTDTVKKLGRIETIKYQYNGSSHGYELWDVVTETGKWHNTPLYKYVIDKQSGTVKKA